MDLAFRNFRDASVGVVEKLGISACRALHPTRIEECGRVVFYAVVDSFETGVTGQELTSVAEGARLVAFSRRAQVCLAVG